MNVHRFGPLVLLALWPAAAHGENPASWQFDLTTSGQDVFWVSPTAVTTGFGEYDWNYHITKLEVRVVVVLPIDLDVTDQLGEAAIGSGTETGLPFVLLNEFLEEPTTGTSADVLLEVDADGFGRASLTNITLGQYNGNNITRIRAEGTASVMGFLAGDYNRDGVVDAADYVLWRRRLADGTTGVDGYGVWQANFAATSAGLTAAHDGAGAAVPEPAALLLGALAIGFVVSVRKRRANDRFAMINVTEAGPH